MYNLYIDESGIPELSSADRYCILSGVLFQDEDEKAISYIFQKIKERYNLDPIKHIHAVEVFERKTRKDFLGKTRRRPKNDLRKQFQKEIWDAIKRYNIKYYVVTVDKESVKKSLGLSRRNDKGQLWLSSSNFYARVDRQLPMDVGVNVIYYWALKQLKSNEKLKVIFESRSGDLFSTRNFSCISESHAFKNRRMQDFSKRFKESAVSIAFANKDAMSTGLELSDIIGYTCNIYFLQVKKQLKVVESSLKKSICIDGIHKTLNKKHYTQPSQRVVSSFIPGVKPRTKRISKRYTNYRRHSLSPALAGSQVTRI